MSIFARVGEIKMKYSELERRLKSQGCYYLEESKKHPMWYSPKTGKIFALSKHRKQEVPRGTLTKHYEGLGD